MCDWGVPNRPRRSILQRQTMKKIAVLVSNSGTGSNLIAILGAIKSKKISAKICVVVSCEPDAPGIEVAKKNNIDTLVIEKNTDPTNRLANEFGADLIILAGWKQFVTEKMLNIFENKILNIHPGLIPDTVDGSVELPDRSIGLWNRGKFTEKAIKNFLDKKSTYAGSTIHLLSKEFDFGPVLERCFIKIKPGDTVESLYPRLKVEENKSYIKAIVKLLN